MNKLMRKIVIVIILFFVSSSLANNIGSNTGLEIPRFVSLKSNESNIRIGPSLNYPIKIRYVVKDFPLKIIDEYEDWRKVSDFQKNTGWIHKSLIKGERTGIINSKNYKEIQVFNSVPGKIIGIIRINSLVFINKCKLNWCLISKDNHKGWVNKENIWGVKNDEEFNIGILQKFIDLYYKSVNLLQKLIINYLN